MIQIPFPCSKNRIENSNLMLLALFLYPSHSFSLFIGRSSKLRRFNVIIINSPNHCVGWNQKKIFYIIIINCYLRDFHCELCSRLACGNEFDVSFSIWTIWFVKLSQMEWWRCVRARTPATMNVWVRLCVHTL